MSDEEHQEITSYSALQGNEGDVLSSSTSSISNKSTINNSPIEDGNKVEATQDNHTNNDEELAKDLENRRALIKTLLSEQDWKEGDTCVVIPKLFIDSFFTTQAMSIDELRNILGPMDFHTIVDNSGQLFPPENEPAPTIAVSQNVFQHLSYWFGVLGQPLERSFITNPQTGVVEIERWPIAFAIHCIGKKPHQPAYFRHGYSRHNHHHHNHNHEPENEGPYFVSVSRTKTFLYLLELIKDQLLKLSKRSIDDFRLWFVSDSKQNELPYLITTTNFVYKISRKNLVPPNVLKRTLLSEGVDDIIFHVVIEYKEKSNMQFPIDTFVQSRISAEENNLKLGGHMGLSNLGNTCYMNSALQCLLHVPEINQYFFNNIYQKELNVDNPLGYNGDVANAFGSLLKSAFDPAKSSSSMSPRDFKHTIGRYSSMFSGYLQQDSQEFLSWLLDALHEDLNRIQKKPYCEKPELKDDEVDDKEAIARLAETCWNQHKQRNDSVITDLFTGLYESILVCPDCGKTSITFDPFSDLTLPLPINKKWYHTFTVVDYSKTLVNGISKVEVELKTTSNYDDLINYLSNFLNVGNESLFLYEVFQHGIYADFQKNRIKNKFLPISDLIKDGDDVVVYIIPHNTETDVIIPVFNVVEDSDTSYRMENYFGIPLFITLSKDQLNSFGTIRQKLLETVSFLTTVDLVGEYELVKQENENYTGKKYYSKRDFPTLATEENGKAEDEYDSDVSLANPYVDADFGFKIKYIYDCEIPSSQKSRFSFNSDSHASTTTIHVPLHKPAISTYKLLSEKLPPSKRMYYHSQRAGGTLAEEKPAEEDKSLSGPEEKLDGYLVSRTNTPQIMPLGRDEWNDSNEAVASIDERIQVEGKSESEASNTLEQSLRPALPPRHQPNSNLNLSDTESEGMFGSSSFMPPQTVCPDSTKPSNINSPLESNFDEEANTTTTLVNRSSVLLCDWDKDIYMKLFGNTSLTTWVTPPELVNQELVESKARFERQRKSKITLAECLRSFSTPEVLGEHDLWYCPNCKDHKRATKSIQIWSTGDILTIHLKRFHSARAFSDKIDVVVDFPIEGLDMKPYLANPSVQEKDCIYDLIAVDNHYGGLGGGHYTASVKNFKDDKWYYFNDSRVTEINNPEELVSSAAYLLFYRKRRPDNESLGGDNLREILKRGEEEYKAKAIEKEELLTDLQKSIDKYHSALRFDQSQDGEIDYESELSTGEVADEKSSGEEHEVPKPARRQRVLSKDGEDGHCSLHHSNSKRQKMNSSPPEDADVSSSENSDLNGDVTGRETSTTEVKID
ncbi:hypothetical protein KGF57_003366 [Candida theae]|uniref:ubiquitinyl hydrolase 1 n=1 Tax=Candida theae TaxID=1198502 RepID=A0AAD5BDJ7_9ASCO|nr:uncharacterized protein KGF57_003366 [Candida theae]KAI5957057.1 hypothetical protein KGF57_003366 [Candida theae]